ncbi:MAG: crossover junction endodeoxyribonuclease RuvC [Candidatus Paceibacterota bacterium]
MQKQQWVSEARGAILYVAKSFGLEIFEYTPLQIKSAVTGYGKATKDAIPQWFTSLLRCRKS